MHAIQVAPQRRKTPSAQPYALERLPRRVLFAAPFNIVPLTPQIVEEDSEMRFSASRGNAIIVSAGASAPTDRLRVTLTATGGVVTLGSLAGIDLINDDGLGNTHISFEATPRWLNLALDGLQFMPAPDYAGPAWLRVETSVAGSSAAVRADDTIELEVTPINDSPTIVTPSGAIRIDEDTPLILGSFSGNAITIKDVDAGDGEVRVTVSATDGSLTLASQQSVASASIGTETITLNGKPADVNAALDGLTFTPAADFSGEATLRVEVDDQGNTGGGQNLTAVAEVSVIIAPVNDAPALALSPAPLAYIEGDGAVPVDPLLGLADADGSVMIRWATIRIVGYVAGQELLGFAGAEGISGHFNPRFGTLTLHGEQTAAAYEAALRSVTYQNLSSHPVETLTRISFTVSDGLSSTAQERIVTLQGVENPPSPPIILPPVGGPIPISPQPDALPGDPLEVDVLDPIVPTPPETDPTEPPETDLPVTPPPETEPPPSGGENPLTPGPEIRPAPEPGNGGAGPNTGKESNPPAPPVLEVPVLPVDPSPPLATQLPLNGESQREEIIPPAGGGASEPVSIPVLEPLQPPAPGTEIPEVSFVTSEGELWNDLDTLREEVQAPEKSLRLLAGVATMGSLSVSMIYILWTVRAGYLLASLLSSVPAWGFIDPLPILDHFGERPSRRRSGRESVNDEDGNDRASGGADESLQSMIAREEEGHTEGATS